MRTESGKCLALDGDFDECAIDESVLLVWLCYYTRSGIVQHAFPLNRGSCQ